MSTRPRLLCFACSGILWCCRLSTREAPICNDRHRAYAAPLFALVILTLAGPPAQAQSQAEAAARNHAIKILSRTPIIDGHNDLPWELHDKFGDQARAVDLSGTPGTPIVMQQTDIARLRAGRVGGQFWSVWIPTTITGAEGVKLTLQQIDLARSFAENNPTIFARAESASDIERIERKGKIASLIGVEGGHQIGDSLAVLRQFYALGARYLTLTHTSNNALADSATDNPKFNGLSPFGRSVIQEMNRIGMLVDLSHVSADTMRQAIAESRAPVIFSHSGARAVTDHPRNVPDDVLKSLQTRDGVVMVDFYSGYVSNASARWNADRAAEVARYNSPPYNGLFIGQPARAAAALAKWEHANPFPAATVSDVANHIDYIVKVAGIDHVGIGSDFDGAEPMANGLKTVADYPDLFAELIRRGWTDEMLEKLSGRNLLRVMRQAERIAGH